MIAKTFAPFPGVRPFAIMEISRLTARQALAGRACPSRAAAHRRRDKAIARVNNRRALTTSLPQPHGQNDIVATTTSFGYALTGYFAHTSP